MNTQNSEPTEFPIEQFPNLGVMSLGNYLDFLSPDSHQYSNFKSLSRKFLALHPAGSLFLSEEEFMTQPNRYGTNPCVGRNACETMDLYSVDSYVEMVLAPIIGPEPQTLMKKFVVGLPDSLLPAYVKKEIAGVPAANLGAFIKPEFRDATYFRGIDFHQDIIDYPGQVADMMTAYVYLDDVGLSDAPLRLLPGSHLEGADTFPHKLQTENIGWVGKVGPTHTMRWYRFKDRLCPEHLLTGKAGDITAWHSCLLHGTAPTEGDRLRVSLRYILAPEATIMRGLNNSLKGPVVLQRTRVDVDEKHTPVVRQNTILKDLK